MSATLTCDAPVLSEQAKVAIRKARLAVGRCPMDDRVFEIAAYGWVRCPHRGCGIIGRRWGAGGAVTLPPGYRYLLGD